MKSRHFLAAGAALAAGFAASVAEAGDWSGPYIGAHVGAIWSDQDLDLGPGSQLANYYFDFNYLPRSIALVDRGFAGGVLAGYNWQSGTLVFGVESDWTALGGTERSEVVDLKDQYSEHQTFASAEVDQIATIRARLGLLLTPRTLAFVTGGLALGRTSVSTHASDVAYACPNTISLCVDGAESGWRSGWVIGGGAEFALTNNWSLRGEYLHYDLGSISFDMAEAPPHDDYVLSTRTEFSGDIARATLNYGF